MAVQSSPVLPQKPALNLTQFTTTATAGSFVTLYTGGTNGSKITSVSATNSSTGSTVLQLAASSTASGSLVNYIISAVTLPAGLGTDGSTPPATLLNAVDFAIDGDGSPYLFLTSSLQALTVTIVT